MISDRLLIVDGLGIESWNPDVVSFSKHTKILIITSSVTLYVMPQIVVTQQYNDKEFIKSGSADDSIRTDLNWLRENGQPNKIEQTHKTQHSKQISEKSVVTIDDKMKKKKKNDFYAFMDIWNKSVPKSKYLHQFSIYI